MSAATQSSATEAAKRWLYLLPIGKLYRAYVGLPEHMTDRDRPLQERVVFFEVRTGEAWSHLEKLLALAWGVDTTDWCERGFIYNINSATELFDQNCSVAPLLHNSDDLRLFECGWGKGGVGPDSDVHYNRAADCDLFVTPRVHARLTAALAAVERLYAASAMPATQAEATERAEVVARLLQPGSM